MRGAKRSARTVVLYDGNTDFQMEEDGQVLHVVRNGVSVEFDAEQGKIRCADWDAFFAPYGWRSGKRQSRS